MIEEVGLKQIGIMSSRMVIIFQSNHQKTQVLVLLALLKPVSFLLWASAAFCRKSGNQTKMMFQDPVNLYALI